MESAAIKLPTEGFNPAFDPRKKLFLIRGLPGSGKSTLAQVLARAYTTEHHYEADDYFVQDSIYKFNPKQIGDAHDWCQKKFTEAINWGACTVIVSNTFTQNWEMETYIEYAKARGYLIQVLECKGEFKNIHGVPDNVVQRMRDRWEEFETEMLR